MKDHKWEVVYCGKWPRRRYKKRIEVDAPNLEAAKKIAQKHFKHCIYHQFESITRYDINDYFPCGDCENGEEKNERHAITK